VVAAADITMGILETLVVLVAVRAALMLARLEVLPQARHRVMRVGIL
jgi:hypothetical protein